MVQTPRLLLRAIRPEDAPEVCRVYALSEALHAPWNPLRPENDTWEALFERSLRRHQEGSSWRGVALLSDGRIGGFFALNELVRGAFQNAYAGWAVNAEVANQGIATEGLRALLEVAFSPKYLALHRVQANIIPRNHASIRVAEKAGMRREGLALRYLQIAGVWEDHSMWALTTEEWAGSQ
jgi:ribosomal-protein-alanine N-acetyltransferase